MRGGGRGGGGGGCTRGRGGYRQLLLLVLLGLGGFGPEEVVLQALDEHDEGHAGLGTKRQHQQPVGVKTGR